MPQKSNLADCSPCRHDEFKKQVDKVKDLIYRLDQHSPCLLRDRNIDISSYDMLFRAAVQSLRGTWSATTSVKKHFIDTILDYGKERGIFDEWHFVGTGNRQDYRVALVDGTVVGIEAKGCPDGNNLQIWDRPGWANEFIVWSMCPDSLVKQPGRGIWSGISTRLMTKVVAENVIVDAMIFWDSRCGSDLRRCPKHFGVEGDLRSRATETEAQDGRKWLPPPCVYLFPRTPPNIRNNPSPPLHTVETCKFANSLLTLFNVPNEQKPSYIHSAKIDAQGTQQGTKIKVTVTSRCWPAGQEREVSTGWKTLKRE